MLQTEARTHVVLRLSVSSAFSSGLWYGAQRTCSPSSASTNSDAVYPWAEQGDTANDRGRDTSDGRNMTNETCPPVKMGRRQRQE
jgi:hypothetical protein